MGDQSAIQWTDATWNPLRGCSRVSEGCRNCYAERVAARFGWRVPDKWDGNPDTPPARYAEMTKAGPRWTGELRLVEDALALPLRWKKPRRIFVNSMSDLFHEKVPDEWIDRVFAVMAWTRRHTYQILTKRPERMRAYATTMAALPPKDRSRRIVASMYRGHPAEYLVRGGPPDERCGDFPWPLPNAWLGVSVENQATADGRIPLLLQTPAAVRFVSYEPALGPVDFTNVIHAGLVAINALTRPVLVGCPIPHEPDKKGRNGLDWIIVGGESGPGARPFDVAWARETIRQAKNSSVPVPVFVKQLGAVAHDHVGDCDTLSCTHMPVRFRDRKGGDWNEWPEDLRVREFPA